MKTEALPGKEDCPGQLVWSAFGATYPDTVCANSLEWPDDYRAWGLCDADDDLREKGIPCPFCDPDEFRDYQFSDCIALWESDESPVAEGIEIHFHERGDGALWWTATHPERGEERVLMRRDVDDEPAVGVETDTGEGKQ